MLLLEPSSGSLLCILALTENHTLLAITGIARSCALVAFCCSSKIG